MRKFRKSLAVVLLSASLIAVASCTKTNNGGNVTPVHDIIDPFLEGTDVFIGDTVTITPREIEKDGKYYPCYDFYTITPDGNRLSGEQQYISVAGQYQTVFLAKLEDGSFITDSDTFKAYERAFNVEKESSSTQYVNELKGAFKTPTSGITATLTEGDSWHYNQIIDISDASLAKPIIKFYSSPMSEFINGDVAPYIDASKQVLRISDYYDPTNYIDVQIGYFLANQGTGRMQTYAVAGGSTQSATGLMVNSRAWGTRRDVTIDGIDYACCFGFDDCGCTMGTVPGWQSNRHPAPDPEHPAFNPDITNSDGFGYSVYFDSVTKRIYIQHNNLYFVTDLDEPIIYNDNTFKGFTTGEVTLSLRFDGYQSSSATFEIEEIYGKKGEELKEIRALDNKAPIIYVDCKKDNFYIARNEEFSVPFATASDAHLKGDVEVEVIYDKGRSDERYITVVDGKFTPTEIGEYTIVYTARDAFENVSTKEIKCQAITCEDNKLVSFDYTKVTDTEAGETITISKPTISSANGEEYADLYIIDPNGEETKYNALESDISYLLRRVGKYKIIYEYGDVAKSYIEQYEFNSEASENVYLETTVFPEYFIKGSKVTLDDNKAVLCDTTDVHYIDTTVQAKFDTGDYETITDINNFEVKGNSTVSFKYLNGNEEIYESAPFPIIDVGFTGTLDLTKYFSYYSNSWTNTLYSNFIELRNNQSDEQLDFINPLSFASFSTKFKFWKRDRFDKFSLILTDYYDPNNAVSLDFAYRSSNLYLTYGDISVSLGDTDTIDLSYDYVSSSLYYTSSSFFHMDNPFTKDRYYLSFKFDNPKTEAVIQLFTIYNQNFKDSIKKDTIAPVLAFNNLTGYYSLGDTIKINETNVCDVLSPYLKDKHELLVEYQADDDADVEIVKSIDGVSLDGIEDADRDYIVKLDKYGIYTLTYSYTDQAGKNVYAQDIVYAIDSNDPVITIEGATSSTIDTCGLNANVKVRNFTVEDESPCVTTIYVISPTDVLSKVEKDTFKANEKGLWKVVYYAVDLYGNASSAYYQVKCQ